MRRRNRASCCSSGTDAGIFRKERLTKAEREQRQVPRIFRKKRNRGLGRIHAHPFLKRVLRVQKIAIVDINFVAAPAQVIAEIVCQSALGGNVRGERPDGDVVSVYRSERTVIGWERRG